WRYLKAHHVDEIGFRRQVPMGKYVADFVSHSTRLIIEVDGESHDFESTLQRDEERDAWFISQGYTMLRFTNEQVLKTLDGVVPVIRQSAAASASPPSLSLPHRGGGNPRTAALQLGKTRSQRSAGSDK